MTIEEAVVRLYDLEADDDNEVVHGAADQILLEFVPPAIRDAYVALKKEVQFWYA